MIYQNLKSGTYRFRNQGELLVPTKKAARDAKTPSEGASLAHEMAVGVETQAALTQAKNIFQGMHSMDDTPFDLNHTDSATIVLNGAPLTKDGAEDGLGAPIVDGFVSGSMSQAALGGKATYRSASTGFSTYFTIKEDQDKTTITRLDGGQHLSIDFMNDTQETVVTVGRGMPELEDLNIYEPT